MPSFDIISEIDLQELDNAVNQCSKEILTRYDFKNSKSKVTLDKTQKTLTILADDDVKMKAVVDILQSKVIKRGISLNSMDMGKIIEAGGSMLRRDVKLVTGIETEKAKEIIRSLKDSKLKVQAQIQDEKVRVSGKKRDDLQEAIAHVKSQDFKIPLQFNNFRD